MQNLVWKIFESSGKISTYLLFKEIEEARIIDGQRDDKYQPDQNARTNSMNIYD